MYTFIKIISSSNCYCLVYISSLSCIFDHAGVFALLSHCHFPTVAFTVTSFISFLAEGAASPEKVCKEQPSVFFSPPHFQHHSAI